MKKEITMCKKLAIALILTAAGCASVAVTDPSILERTAATLGVNQNQLTITDRSDSGIQTSYKAKTADGRTFNCYVTGTISVIGRTVSDAMCNEPGHAGTIGTSDNALLREYNKGFH
jgi:hypothetical protein